MTSVSQIRQISDYDTTLKKRSGKGRRKTPRMFFNVQEANFPQETEAICFVRLKNVCMSSLCFNFKTCVLRLLNRSCVMTCNNRIHPHPPILMRGTREKNIWYY